MFVKRAIFHTLVLLVVTFLFLYMDCIYVLFFFTSPCPSILLVFACYLLSNEQAQQAQAQGVRGHPGLYLQHVTERDAKPPLRDSKWPQDT